MTERVEVVLAVAGDLNYQLMARHKGLSLEGQIAAVDTLKAALEAEQRRRISETIIKNIGKQP